MTNVFVLGRPFVALVSAASIAACAHSPATSVIGTSAAPGFDQSNPFARASTLPYEAPPFDRIRNETYQPALDEGMRVQLAEVQAIVNQSAPPTFENTIVALERSGQLLARVSKTFFGVIGANTNDTLQKVQEIEAPKLAAHSDAINLDEKLFQRIKSLHDRRDQLGLNAEQAALVNRYYRDFVRAGALLSPTDKEKMRAFNAEESKLTTQFQNKLLAATKAAAVVVDNKKDLAGLSDAEIAAAAEAGKERNLPGKYVIVLQNTTQQPLQTSLANRALREKLFNASINRAERGDSNDTRAVIARLAQLRADRAKLLGYSSYAAYALDTQGAKTPENAIGLLAKLADPATAKARGEAADMQKLIDAQASANHSASFKLAPWDWQYYAEQVRKQKYDLDEAQIKPYFELNSVLQNGVFYAANKMYGITFKERHDIPVYNPDVRVFEVFDKDGTSLALWYCDYFKRDNKGGGAWMDSFVDQSKLMGRKPVVYNVANFQTAAPGQPQLLSFDDVTTMFHEFGHALHGMFSNVTYPTFSGANTPRDFVEFPSQFNEHWALEPSVFANYAKHYQTGAPMPASLVAKIKVARTFDQGFATTEYLSASLLDLAWHSQPAGSPLQDVDTFEKKALEQYHVAMYEVPPRYRSTYFAHIWSTGYAAGYYAYMWSEVLDDDAYDWFMHHGGMTAANGQRFRDMILSRGGTEDAAAMYRAFAGRDPSIEPLMDQRGLVAPKAQP